MDQGHQVLHKVGLTGVSLIKRSDERRHLLQAEQQMLQWAQEGHQCSLSGDAKSIQTLKKMLNAACVAPSRVKVKPYWAVGKAGLN